MEQSERQVSRVDGASGQKGHEGSSSISRRGIRHGIRQSIRQSVRRGLNFWAWGARVDGRCKGHAVDYLAQVDISGPRTSLCPSSRLHFVHNSHAK